MACEYCTDPDGECCFPMYDVGPHIHVGVTAVHPGSWIGSTQALPKEEWPTNYQEDKDCPGMGVYWCPHCGEGKPESSNAALTGGEAVPVESTVMPRKG